MGPLLLMVAVGLWVLLKSGESGVGRVGGGLAVVGGLLLVVGGEVGLRRRSRR